MSLENDNLRVQVIGAPGIRWMNAFGVGNITSNYAKETSEKSDYDYQLDGSLMVKGDDYLYFDAISKSQKRYDDIRVNVFQRCNSGTYQLDFNYLKIYSGYISLREADFDPLNCAVKLKVNVIDKYKDYDDRKGDEYNIFEITSARTTTKITGLDYDLQNGVPLQAVLLGLIRESLGFTAIKSDFFQWNSSNPSYTIGNCVKLRNLVVHNQSDILLSGVDGYIPSTIMNLKLDDVVSDLCAMANLRYFIDDNNTFCIEHVSWFEQTVGLDLTDLRYKEYVNGKIKFSFDKPKIFRRELFEGVFNIGADFIGKPIVYDNAFTRTLSYGLSTIDKETQELKIDKKIQVKTFRTDLYWIILLDGSLPENKEGIVLIAQDPTTQKPQKDPTILDLSDHDNNVLSWALLHHNFYRYDRLFEKGFMNGVETTFLTTQRIKLQEELTFPLCCGEYINTNQLVRTQLGDGVIKSLSINHLKGFAKIIVAFEYEATTTIDAPTAVDDFYTTEIDVPIDTDAESKPSLLDNDIGATSVVAETKPTSRSGTVEIEPNGHFVYTPPSGEKGVDSFEYIALNGSGNADFGKCSIGIRPDEIFVHLVQTERIVTIIVSDEETGFPVPRDFYYYESFAAFFEDSTLFIPLDLTGFGIKVKTGYTHNGVVTPPYFVDATGYQVPLVHSAFPGEETSGDLIATLFPDPSYTLV